MHRCGKCSSKNDVDVDLGSLAIKRLEIEPIKEGQNLFNYELPVTKKSVVFKFLTGKDEKDEEVQEDNGSDLNDITDNQKGNKEINVD